MELMLAGIGIILSLLTWRYMWQPTVLDSARDKLFDLRDRKVRGWFVENKVSMDSPVYRALRDLLNGMLKETESMTFAQVVALLVWSNEHKELEAERRRDINKRFETDNPELGKLVKEVREKAAWILLGYVVESSPLALMLAVIGIPIQLAVFAWKSFWRAMANGRSVSPQFRTQLAAALFGIMAVLGITSRATAQATMEEKAFSVSCHA
jgi:hypothetical protein